MDVLKHFFYKIFFQTTGINSNMDVLKHPEYANEAINTLGLIVTWMY